MLISKWWLLLIPAVFSSVAVAENRDITVDFINKTGLEFQSGGIMSRCGMCSSSNDGLCSKIYLGYGGRGTCLYYHQNDAFVYYFRLNCGPNTCTCSNDLSPEKPGLGHVYRPICNSVSIIKVDNSPIVSGGAHKVTVSGIN